MLYTGNFLILIDIKQETDDKLRLRTGIFPGDVQYVYLLS